MRLAGCRTAIIVVVLGLAACASHPDAGGLTGLGATATVWHAHHGAGYSDLDTDAHGRVRGYTLTLAPGPLADAIAQVRRDLPADATASAARLVVGIEGTKCEIVDFTSASLGRALGSDGGSSVMAVFQTSAAITMDTSMISQAVVVSGTEHRPAAC